MIVKEIRAGKAGCERVQMEYALDFKREHAADLRSLGPVDKQAAYALDLHHGGEKVEWARTVNTGVDDPRWAIRAIEHHNAQNTRKHRISRCTHYVVSFVEGERPTREQMAVIEDRLMAKIGFGDHPRVSAVHKPDGHQVDNWHLHIVVSRIDPKTLKAEHPRFNYFDLQAEAAKLEIELGLKQERKTLLPRERQEIDRLRETHESAVDPHTPGEPAKRAERERQALDRATERAHEGLAAPTQSPSRAPELVQAIGRQQFDSVVEGWHRPALPPEPQPTRPADTLSADLLQAITSALESRDPGEQTSRLIDGIDRAVYINTGSEEPPSDLAKSLMRVATAALSTPEPEAVLIKGTTEAIRRHDRRQRQAAQTVAIPQQREAGRGPGNPSEIPNTSKQEPVVARGEGKGPPHVSPPSKWRIGKMLGQAFEAVLDWIAPRVEADPHQQPGVETPAQSAPVKSQEEQLRELAEYYRQNGYSQPESEQERPHNPLLERYKVEREAAYQARRSAEEEVYRQFAAHSQDTRTFYNLRYEQEKAAVEHGRVKHDEFEVIKAERAADRVASYMARDQALAAVRAAHPVPNWKSWLEREAGRGDRDAARALARHQEREAEHDRER